MGIKLGEVQGDAAGEGGLAKPVRTDELNDYRLPKNFAAPELTPGNDVNADSLLGTRIRIEGNDGTPPLQSANRLADQSQPVFDNERTAQEARRLQAQLESEPRSREAVVTATQSALDEWTKRAGLPRVQVLMPGASSEEQAGGYAIGQGEIYLTEGMKPHEIALTAVHEGTHFDQDVLVARRFMDELGVKRQLSTEDREDLQALYEKITGFKASPEFLDSVSAVRDGRQLTDSERKRADLLVEGIYDKTKDPDAVSTTYGPTSLVDRFRESLKTDGFGETRNFIQSLAVNDQFAAMLGDAVFGKPEMTKEEFSKAMNVFGEPNAAGFSEQLSTRFLQVHLDNRREALSERLQEQIDKYKNRFHEAEAYRVQDSIESAMQNK